MTQLVRTSSGTYKDKADRLHRVKWACFWFACVRTEVFHKLQSSHHKTIFFSSASLTFAPSAPNASRCSREPLTASPYYRPAGNTCTRKPATSGRLSEQGGRTLLLEMKLKPKPKPKLKMKPKPKLKLKPKLKPKPKLKLKPKPTRTDRRSRNGSRRQH